jgi:predicted ABC-type ATPase
MNDSADLNRRPIIVAVAGPNGAGKTTFFHSYLAASGLRFVNADVLAAELAIDPYQAARLADSLRRALVAQRESFVFETVFSDPVGDRIAFLKQAIEQGYSVILCFIGLSGPDQSIERVAIRVSQGKHDVPEEKLRSRYPRVLANLKSAIQCLPHVWIYDNSDLSFPFRLIARFAKGKVRDIREPLPEWLRPLIS